MNEIKLLDKETIDKIAAGEVVDRPASIVKELVENSIDSGARSISIEIRDGGTSMIRITDNGSGIPHDQIRTAFLRHSTSKISTASDLSFISTLGFRGEALSSIAAVSKVELCTKTAGSLTGSIYRIEGGAEVSFEDAGLPDGTTVIVKDLFFNTPARLKFLKSAQTEAGAISDIVQRIALSHPDISFKFTLNGLVKLSTSGNGSLKDTIYSVFGRDITSNLMEINDQRDLLGVNGFIGKPEIARGNRNFEFFFINGRYVKDRIIQKAVEDAYTGYQMKGTFPFIVINITMEPELVDVNVHPSKLEVRFFSNEAVFECIYDIIRKRIVRRENIPSFTIGPAESYRKPDNDRRSITKVVHPEPFEQKRFEKYTEEIAKPPVVHDISIDVFRSVSDHNEPEPVKDFRQASLFEDRFISETARASHRIIGTVFDTYWIVEYDEKVYFIDQHAAHEKVLYERFMARLKNQSHYSQKLFPALILTLSAQEEEALKKYNKSLSNMGFEIEPFGGSEYAVSAIPADIYTVDNRLLLTEMLGELSGYSASNEPEILTDRIATAACKAAVKGGNRLSLSEADALIDELLKLENPYNCPHGRPTMISMSKYELEKKFKRII